MDNMKTLEIRRVRETYQRILKEFESLDDLNIKELNHVKSMLRTSIHGLLAVEKYRGRIPNN